MRPGARPCTEARYSLNVAIAVSPALTFTLFDLVAPLGGRQVTEYVPGFSVRRSDDDVPLPAPFTENAHDPPTASASSVPFPPPDGLGSTFAGGGAGAAPPVLALLFDLGASAT